MGNHVAFAVNCCSATSLVFLNRRLLHRCQFQYVGFLAALHLAVTAAVAHFQAPPSASTKHLTKAETTFFLFVTVVSLVSMNLSLMLNHVGVYQLAKLAMIPTCAMFEYFVSGRVPTTAKMIAMFFVIIGVLTACVLKL
jgi:hypothetical protein